MDKTASKAFRVLVTGSSGKIGQVVCKALRDRGHDVVGFDRAPALEGSHAPTHVGDLTDIDAVRRAIDGVDSVVHLAAYIFTTADFLTDLIEPNVRGLYHVVEAAREQAVRRLVLASSINATTGVFEHGGSPRPVAADERYPITMYGLTKLWAEDLGRMYARLYGLSVVSARVGWFPRDRDDALRLHRYYRGAEDYVSHRDTARFFVAAVEAEQIDYLTAYAVGPGDGNSPSPYDLAPGRERLGYEPRDVFPVGQPFAVETSH